MRDNRGVASNEMDCEVDCDAVLGSDLSSIVIDGGFDNGALDYEDSNFDNSTNRVDKLLDVGHHYDDCGDSRFRTQMCADQILAPELP